MRIKLSLLKSCVKRAIEESYDKDKKELREDEFFKLLRKYINEEGQLDAKSSRLKAFISEMFSILDKNMNEIVEDYKKEKAMGGKVNITEKLIKYKRDLMSIFESSGFRENVRKTNPDFSDADFENIASKVEKEFYNIWRSFDQEQRY